MSLGFEDGGEGPQRFPRTEEEDDMKTGRGGRQGEAAAGKA